MVAGVPINQFTRSSRGLVIASDFASEQCELWCAIASSTMKADLLDIRAPAFWNGRAVP
jgi:hypothetical protein